MIGSAWAYKISSEKIVLIPIVASVMLLTLNNALKYEQKPQHIGGAVISLLTSIGQYIIVSRYIGETDMTSKYLMCAMIVIGLVNAIFLSLFGLNFKKKSKFFIFIFAFISLFSCVSSKNKEQIQITKVDLSVKKDTLADDTTRHTSTLIAGGDNIDNTEDNSQDTEIAVDQGDYDINYIMGKFEPDKRKDFMEIPPIYVDRAGRYLRVEVFHAFKRMYEAAKKDGIKLKIISATRNFENQKTIWENKWTGRTLLEGNINATSFNKGSERAIQILKYSSMPGTSRHHWGTDIDINALENSYFESGVGKKEYDWLQSNGAKFGFCQTYTAMFSDRNTGYQEEKWHWTYMPISSKLTLLAKKILRDDMINGFLGSEAAIEIEVVEKYVLAISPKCIQD
jgi:LAS superfamily LD-carboxypeptidase LdcB